MDNVKLQKGQFEIIQEQHKKTLLARAERKSYGSRKKSVKPGERQGGFCDAADKISPGKKDATLKEVWSLNETCDDDLGLQLETGEKCTSNELVLQEEISELSEAVRVLKDENGRLHKLLGEKDEEILKLRKNADEERKLLLGSGVITDKAAARIMEVSRQNRDLKAELECEKNRIKLLEKKLLDSESERKLALTEQDSLTDKKDKEVGEIVALQEKLFQTSNKMAELRNKCEMLKKELRVAYKVLSREIGEGFNITTVLNEPSGFRGRQQQIITLQNKIAELSHRLQLTATPSITPKAVPVRSSLSTPYPMTYSTSGDDKHRTVIKKMEKQRKDEQEKVLSEFALLKEDHCKLQQKHEASKLRNKVLSEELKGIKLQLKTLIEKGIHDDELIAALTEEQKHLKDTANQILEAPKRATTMDSKTWEVTDVENLMRQCQIQEDKICELESEVKRLRVEQKTPVAIATSSGVNITTQTEWREMDSRNQWMTTKSSDEDIHKLTENKSLGHNLSGNNPNPGNSLSNTMSSSFSDVYANHSIWRKRACISEDLQDLRTQLQENKTLSLAAEVEKDRLLQLVAVLQKRITASDCKFLDATNQLQQLRLKTVQLEKELGLAQTSRPHNSKSVNKSRKPNPESESQKSNRTEDQTQRLQMSLQIQVDENNALKEALNSAMKEKEQDLMVYQEMMQHAKNVFLQGLRQFRQNSATS